MIFWALTLVAVIGVIAVFWYFIEDDGWLGALLAFICSLGIGLLWLLIAVGAVAVGLNHAVGATSVTTETTDLKAIGSDSSVHGRSYFLGGGWVDGKRVLSYIATNEDGSYSTGQVDGSEARIYEDDDAQPSMVTRTHIADRWWISPPISVGETYDFTVPAGSVTESYEITP